MPIVPAKAARIVTSALVGVEGAGFVGGHDCPPLVQVPLFLLCGVYVNTSRIFDTLLPMRLVTTTSQCVEALTTLSGTVAFI